MFLLSFMAYFWLLKHEGLIVSQGAYVSKIENKFRCWSKYFRLGWTHLCPGGAQFSAFLHTSPGEELGQARKLPPSLEQDQILPHQRFLSPQKVARREKRGSLLWEDHTRCHWGSSNLSCRHPTSCRFRSHLRASLNQRQRLRCPCSQFSSP